MRARRNEQIPSYYCNNLEEEKNVLKAAEYTPNNKTENIEGERKMRAKKSKN